MVFSRTWKENVECAYKNKVFVNSIFVLARNYKVFIVDMDSLVQVNLHFNKELQWFRSGHGFFSSSESSFQHGIAMVSFWTWIF